MNLTYNLTKSFQGLLCICFDLQKINNSFNSFKFYFFIKYLAGLNFFKMKSVVISGVGNLFYAANRLKTENFSRTGFQNHKCFAMKM